MRSWIHNRTLRCWLELSVVVVIAFFYVIFRKTLGFKPHFIFPIAICGLSYVIFEVKTGDRKPRDFGLRFDNLPEAARVTFFAFAAPILAPLLFGIWRGTQLPEHFYYTLLLYPLWGILQQFVFQGIFMESLLRLGAGLFAIPLSALFYASVHWPSTFMLTVTFLGGLLFAGIYYFKRNIIPIGIAHGIFGALLFYVVLGRDPFAKFIAN